MVIVGTNISNTFKLMASFQVEVAYVLQENISSTEG